MLECRNVNFTWERSGQEPVETLRHVSFSANDGEVVAIIGPSGCGKSTLLQILAGLEQARGGQVLIDSREVVGPSSERGMIFQTPNLFPWLKVGQNVEFGLRVKGLNSQERRKMADDSLRRVGLLDWREHYPHQLSGGMKQRVALARALVSKPHILLVDEPLTSLDAQTRIHMMKEFFLQQSVSNKPTIIYVTHFVDEAVLLADKVVVMSARPAVVLEEVIIDLSHPRDSSSIDFYSYWRLLSQRLSEEFRKTFSESDRLGAADDYYLNPGIKSGVLSNLRD